MNAQIGKGLASTLGLMLALSISASAQANWNQLPGCAKSNAGAWVVGCDTAFNGGRGIYHWNGSSWGNPLGRAVDITLDATANPWVVNDSGRIFSWNGSVFIELSGGPTVNCGTNVQACVRHEYGASTIAVDAQPLAHEPSVQLLQHRTRG